MAEPTFQPSAVVEENTPDAKTILLVEDHEDSAAVFERLLIRRGYRVLRASTLLEGLAILEQSPVDLLIADLSLPDGSGLELLRPSAAKARPPAIALSGHSAPDDLRRSRESGFARHLVKPVDFPVLCESIQELLARP